MTDNLSSIIPPDLSLEWRVTCFVLPIVALVLAGAVLGLDDPSPTYLLAGWSIGLIVSLGIWLGVPSRPIKAAAKAFSWGCLVYALGIAFFLAFCVLMFGIEPGI